MAQVQNKIQVEHITFGYEQQPLFADLSVTFQDNEFCAIVGSNGSGKTTLLKCIDRLLPFRTGDILVNGQTIRQYTPTDLAKIISYVPQSQEQIFDVPVYDIVMMGLYPYQKKWQAARPEDDVIVRQMLDRCHLTHLKGRFLRELSGGERQRTLIARAMAQQTPIMLLDEPLANLDVAHRYEIMDILANLNRQGVMVIIVMHDFPIALEYATHALLMKGGAVLQHDLIRRVLTPDNIRTGFDLDSQFLIDDKGHISKSTL
jgi:iron complex transport system ATP-binding protein